MVRRPAVAGYFYPADPGELRGQIDALIGPEWSPAPARAVIVPHGSYRHAGAVLGSTFRRVTIPRRCIILGPSHTNSWMSWSVMAAGAYRTPLGDVPIDEACAEMLQLRCPFLEADAWGQHGEHAIEVQMPFLQRLGPPDLTVVPILAGSDDPEEFAQMAQALAQVVRMQEEPVLLIATSDLTHYQPQARAAKQDRVLIDAMATLDHAALIRCGQERSILMCGYGAAACVLEAVEQLGASSAELAAYGTSAQAGGDPHSVIGYAGMTIK